MARDNIKSFLDVREFIVDKDNERGLKTIAELQEQAVKHEHKSEVAGKVAKVLLPTTVGLIAVAAVSKIPEVKPVVDLLLGEKGMLLLESAIPLFAGASLLTAYDKHYYKYNQNITEDAIDEISEQIATNELERGVIEEMRANIIQPQQVDPALYGDEAEIHPAVNINVPPKPGSSFGQVAAHFEKKMYMTRLENDLKSGKFVDENGNPWYPNGYGPSEESVAENIESADFSSNSEFQP